MSTENLPISIISKENKKQILTSLFTEGVFVVKKDNRQVYFHHYLTTIPNLQAMMIMKSLHSKKFVTESFAWRYQYFTLTDAGVAYLRDYLHLNASEVPKTHKVSALPERAPRTGGPRGPRTGAPLRRGPRAAPKTENKEL